MNNNSLHRRFYVAIEKNTPTLSMINLE